jgi:hypothetical protein
LGRGVLVFLSFGLLAGLASGAVPLGNSNVQIGGFLSQGYIQSDGNNYPFEDKDGTFDFREMGFNASTTVGAHLRVGAQLFAQRLGNYGDDKVKLDWAVADYNFCQQFGIRVGRVKYPKGLYGEALDLDAIRPFIFLPMALYNPILRDFSSAFNGGMIYGNIPANKAGSFDYKVFYGKVPVGPDQGVADFLNNAGLFAPPGVQVMHIDYTAGVQVQWNTPINGLKAVASYSYLQNLFTSGKFIAFPVVDSSLKLDRFASPTFSLEYIRDQWTFAGEYQPVSGTSFVTTPFGGTVSDVKMNNWYVSVARRLNDKIEVGAYYSVQDNKNPPAGSPHSANYNRDWALSLKYELNEHVTFKIEGHTIDGVYGIFNTTRNPNPKLDNHTNFFAVKTTLSF